MRCGKTTIALMLATYLPNTYRVSFGDEVRREVARGMGYDGDYQRLFNINKNQLRPVLQAWGHNMREIRGEDVWVNALFNRMVRMAMHDPNRIFIIDDVRYLNEAYTISNFQNAHILNYKAHTIRMICGRETQIRRGANPQYLDHSSETQLDLDAAFQFDSHCDSNDDDFHALFFDILKGLQMDRMISETVKRQAWSRYLADKEIVPVKTLDEYGE